ncbi:DUF4177 domain-containing protein [Mucilaginibacter sp. RS28]|uniref:DUF4177 domain-containing protein n=1 Tax=Mucilaginibacter straminoryzae TaxID=2932774 RepID=A0A9X1X604_9SPHI|nr:DUF4177 domain-containing protein [Mucilaginibacter straminoryzae]MCJ8211767.1 DUF4177 domain-containing protein [Mucilaginibacter straminoryzae]
MKKLCLILICLLPLIGFAQKRDSITYKAKEIYCVMTGVERTFSSKLKFSVDYGQLTPYNDLEKKAETDKLQSFDSAADALNYMAMNGWELVSTTPYNSSLNTDKSTRFMFILKRKR